MSHACQTQLHSAAQSNDLEIAELLLRDGADIYSKNDKGLTPFHILVQIRIIIFDSLHATKKDKSFSSILYREENCKALDARKLILGDRSQSVPLHSPAQQRSDLHAISPRFISKQEYLTAACKKIEESERFLLMLLKHKDVDPTSIEESRLLKFHAACTLKNASIADKLCDQVVDINESVCQNSPIYPGYTALHFASYCNVNLVKTLISKGANLLTPDFEGVTPFQICIKSFELKDIQSILAVSPECRNILFSNGKTKLTDYLSSLHNAKNHEKLLLSMGLDTGISLPKDSPVWPGYTVLHLALTFLPEAYEPNPEFLLQILRTNSNIVTKQDIHGSTPIHMAFHQNKLKTVELLLSHQKTRSNPLDKDNLSHLHIAAAVNNQQLTEEILQNEENVNIAYKGKPLPLVELDWTPLNTAAHTNHLVITRALLERGANLLQKDARGFTVVHQLLGSPNKKVANCIFASRQLKESVVEDVGLTHLHVAVWQNNDKAIERLLNLGSDIEATIGQLEQKELKKFVNCRPIHVAMMNRTRLESFKVLLRRGADIFAKKTDQPSPFLEILSGTYNAEFVKSMVYHFWSNKELQTRMYNEMGITMLHFVCYLRDIEKIKELLPKGFDVNAKIRDDSIVWPGFTPLHVLVAATLNLQDHKFLEFYRLLLEKGADVTLSNTEGDTSVHMGLKATNRDIGNHRAALLLQYQRDFSVNPVNKAGMSHFHVACLLNKATAVESFLKDIPDINVNQQISSNNDSGRFAGHTPLLLTLSSRAKLNYEPESQVRVVRLLLERGADIHAVDAFGYTPLHKLAACAPTRNKLLRENFIDDTDINKRAVDGTKPMEILLLDAAPSEEVDYFVKRGAIINSYNSVSDVGYLAIVLTNKKYKTKQKVNILKKMINSRDIAELSGTGRNAIHNSVASLNEYAKTSAFEYCDLIKKLMTLGCDIFQQDTQGRTALHLAVQFKNKEALVALLECGVDVNSVDSVGRSPFYYASVFRKDKQRWIPSDFNADVYTILALHLIKLQLVGLQVSKLNSKLLSEIPSNRDDINTKIEEINRQLERASKIKMCKRGFSLRNFLYATGPVSSLKASDRGAVDSFFKRGDDNTFSELTSLLTLQYKNVQQRPSLIAPALGGLNVLLGLPLPELCAQIILTYLTNSDLRNLTAAATQI